VQGATTLDDVLDCWHVRISDRARGQTGVPHRTSPRCGRHWVRAVAL